MTTASASVFPMHAMQKSMRKTLWSQVKWIGSGRRDSTPAFGKSTMTRRSGLWRKEKLPRLPGDPIGTFRHRSQITRRPACRNVRADRTWPAPEQNEVLASCVGCFRTPACMAFGVVEYVLVLQLGYS
ncbi:unnamed protein product [Symbiodinium sp. CCMP2592]|nr:unnamed protein product [Symbiodinium sp. CCMP2592]